MTKPSPIAVSLGEPAGIGPELTLKAWAARRAENVPTFFAIGDPDHYQRLSERFQLAVPVETIARAAEAEKAFERALPVLPLRLSSEATLGRPTTATADSVLAAIATAVDLAAAGAASAVVTNPIHKSVLYAAGFDHPGHTEYLGARFGLSGVMMLSCPGLRTVPVTVHLPLAEVATHLSADKIVACGEVLAESLRNDFGIENPRLAVAALNPHAGESGTLGREEIEIIQPAAERLRAMGIDIMGPAPADTLFHAAARARYDAALCMYHDQALIPLKTIDFQRGVNTTLGLPIVRTSPDHGTALDIAEKGIADADSLIEAIRQAGLMADRRLSQRGTVT